MTDDDRIADATSPGSGGRGMRAAIGLALAVASVACVTVVLVFFGIERAADHAVHGAALILFAEKIRRDIWGDE